MLGTSLPVEKLPAVEEDLFAFMGIDVYMSDRIASPITYGIFRQKILIPKIFMDLPREQLKYVLIHEKIHIERYDNLRKFLMILAVCLHWFNPMVWVMYYFYNRDIEISCDEKVLKRVGKDSREDYASALIYLAEHGTGGEFRKKPAGSSGFTGMYSGFGQNAIRERILFIMKYRKGSGMAVVCAVVLALPLAASFVTVSARKPETDKPLTEIKPTARPVVYQHVATVEGELFRDSYKNTVAVKAINADGISICFRIWKDRGYAECHGELFSDNLEGREDFAPGVKRNLSGTLRIPDAVEYKGIQYPVEVIGDYSFYQCRKLTKIELPATVKRILKNVFTGCESLTEQKIPAGVTEIDGNPFEGCTSLEKIIVETGDGRSKFKSREGVLYSDFGRYLKVYPPGREEKVFRIPEDVTRIAKKACYRAGFSKVVIPDAVYLIHTKAFAKCPNLGQCSVPEEARVAKDAFDQTVIRRERK